MGEKRVPVLDGKVYGEAVSEEGLERNLLDYGCLGHILISMGGCILNNYIYPATYDGWELYSGTDYDEEDDCCYDIYQYYIIAGQGAEFLEEHSDEIVYYNEELDMYLWGVCHFGTIWSGVMTDIELVPWNEYFGIQE